MVDRCSLGLVFADDIKTGTWGKGSTLAINACIRQHKPVFAVTDRQPEAPDGYHILPTSLFGVVRGYFIVSSTIGATGTLLQKEAVA